MRLILLGSPGAGKGTQAVNISEKYKIPHISTGDIFRENIKNRTELGKKAKEFIDKGLLVPDEVTIGIVKERLAINDCNDGFLLDGFPRTIEQAEKLDEILSNMKVEIGSVINIHVDDSEIVDRMSGRRVCSSCSMSYHVTFNPPNENGKCNKCGADVVQRDDDKEETVRNRLKTYHKQTEPLIEYYENKNKLINVNGSQSIESTTGSIFEALNGV